VCFHRARKIKIESSTEEFLQVFEVQVLSGGANVALSGNATQSSTWKNILSKFGPAQAIDGDLTSFSHTADSNS
jgi:hypothetical protein